MSGTGLELQSTLIFNFMLLHYDSKILDVCTTKTAYRMVRIVKTEALDRELNCGFQEPERFYSEVGTGRKTS